MSSEIIDNDFILLDRIEVIRQTNEKYNLLDNACISFSGGKDSTVLSHLIDLALPGNKIPRVYINTGIEYNAIVDFVKECQKKDKRIEIIAPSQNIKKTLEQVGYPFKSKGHSHFVGIYQHSGMGKSVNAYLGNSDWSKLITCPKKLMYQFSDDFKIGISDKCCNELKKKPFHKYQSEHNRTIIITGMHRDEGGERRNINCIVVSKDNKHIKFHPLAKVDSQWEEWFINKYNINLCKLYYPPYNFKRTGCKGCPFALELQNQLTTMSSLGMEDERQQCEIIWKPVYEEYRRIGYRLKKEEQLRLL